METAVDSTVIHALTLHGPGLERYVRSLVRDADEAADICQEVAFRLLIATRGDRLPDMPGAWMKRVAHNIVVSSARHRAVADRSADRLVSRDIAASPEDTVVERERDRAVGAALLDARRDDRAAMVLAATGFRTAEIATRLGRTELATRTLLSRARGRMRERLAADAV